MEPLDGSIRSPIKRISVLLPQPDGPISETNSPGAIWRDTFARAVTCPAPPANVLVRLSIAIIGGVFIVPAWSCILFVANNDEPLGYHDDTVEKQTDQARDDHRSPQVLRSRI